MGPRDHIRYFADENAMGMAKVLARDHGRQDVVYPGHSLLPEVRRGALDSQWMPVVAALGLIVLTRDKRIRTRPAELRVYREHGVRSVWIGGKHDMAPGELAELFVRAKPRLVRLATKLGRGPWAITLTRSGARELRLGGGKP